VRLADFARPMAAGQQKADLLQQPLVDDGWARAVAAAWTLEPPAFAATARRGGSRGEVERLPGGTTEVLAPPPTCRLHSRRGRDVMVTERR
jgi:hypothetical protein